MTSTRIAAESRQHGNNIIVKRNRFRSIRRSRHADAGETKQHGDLTKTGRHTFLPEGCDEQDHGRGLLFILPLRGIHRHFEQL